MHNPIGDLYSALTYDDAPAAIEWLCQSFGFQRRLVVPGPDGKIIHSELSLGNAIVMVSSPKPEMGRTSPGSLASASHCLCIHVADADRHFEIAQAAGAVIMQIIQDEDYGSRGYMAKDIEGHLWYFGTYRPGAYWDNSLVDKEVD